MLAPPAPAAFSDLAVGAFHGCAVDTDGQPWCWGRGDRGALGTGGRGDRFGAVPVEMPPGEIRFTLLAAGGDQTCGLTDDGGTFCWGTAASVPGGESLTPARIHGAPGFVGLAAGEDHACGLAATGEIHCWGSNDRGQLGWGDTPGRETPAGVAGAQLFTSVTAGGRHSCGLVADGEAFCWGGNDQGQLGDGSQLDRLVPGPVAPGYRFDQLDAGHVNTCGLDGTQGWCWGSARNGEPGDYSYWETREPAVTPQRVGGTLLTWEFSSIYAGRLVICAVHAGARAQGICWGNGEFGQVGNGRTSDQAGPQLLSLHPLHHHHGDWLRFAVLRPDGVGHACGLSLDGAVFCWGTGERGELGTEETFSAFPRRVRQGG